MIGAGYIFLLGALFVLSDHDVFLESFNNLKREEEFGSSTWFILLIEILKDKISKI